MSDARLAELAAAVGLQLDWQDANGRPQRVDPEVQRAEMLEPISLKEFVSATDIANMANPPLVNSVSWGAIEQVRPNVCCALKLIDAVS